MIPNPNQLTAELRMMPDQQLIRFAQLHKADPYIFPMVVAEDTARKQMRAQAQAQGYRPQPTVADQALMGMEQPQQAAGLAALPAQNIAHMADGGIAGYDDGGVAMQPGATPSYQRTSMSPGMLDFAQRSEPVVRMSEGGVARFAERGLVPTTGSNLYEGRGGTLLPATTGYEGMSIDDFLKAAYNDVSSYVKSLYGKLPKGSLAQAVAQDIAEKKKKETGVEVAEEPPLISPETGKPYTLGAAATPTETGLRELGQPTSAASAAAPSAQARPPITPTGAAPATGIAAAPAGGAGQILDTTEQATIRRLNQMRLDAQRRADEEQIKFESGKPKGEAGAGLAAALQKEAEAEPGEREQAKAMAIFNAGLAMMAGGSPYALQNIGAGALAGTKEYAGALKEFKQAGRERMKMQADIDQARRAETRDDNKTALSLFMRAGDRQDKIEDHMAEAGLKLGLSKADIKSKMEIAQLEQTGAMARTQVQAAAHDPLALFRALGSGDVEKGYEKAQQLKAEPMTEANLKKSWATNMALQMQYPNVQDFIRMMMSTGSPGATDTSGFKVVGVRNP